MNTFLLMVALAGPGSSLQPPEPAEVLREFLFAQRRSCSAASNCEEAVQMWCDGYSGADRDDDGIPCESVCSTKAQVDEIREEIGC